MGKNASEGCGRVFVQLSPGTLSLCLIQRTIIHSFVRQLQVCDGQNCRSGVRVRSEPPPGKICVVTDGASLRASLENVLRGLAGALAVPVERDTAIAGAVGAAECHSVSFYDRHVGFNGLD